MEITDSIEKDFIEEYNVKFFRKAVDTQKGFMAYYLCKDKVEVVDYDGINVIMYSMKQTELVEMMLEEMNNAQKFRNKK